jgi:hypothetical protein
MFLDDIKAKGKVTIELFNENGEKYFENTIDNLVVLVGRAWIAARMKDTGIPVQMTHMELGQGTTAPTASDTTIQTPFTPQGRVALSVAGGTVSSNTVTYTATFPAGTATGAVTEAAIFNNSTVGTMLCRTVFPVVNKPAADVLAISWQVSIIA